MTSTPFLKMYINDMVGDTMHLSVSEFGQYHLMLYAMWNAGGSLPDDKKLLRKVCRGQKLSENVRAFFYEEDGKLRNKRLDQEITKRKNLAANGAKRHQKNSQSFASKSLKNNETRSADTLYDRRYSIEDNIVTLDKVTNIPPPTSPSEKQSSPTKGVTLCPEDWLPREEDLAWAVENGFTADQIREARDTMVDWSRGNNKRRKNWSAVWRNWLRREGKACRPRRQSNLSSVFDQIDTERAWHDFADEDDPDDAPWSGRGSEELDGSISLISKQRS